MRKTPPSQPPSRQNILKMTELLKQFEPLVNEKREIIGFKHRATDYVESGRIVEMLMVMTGAIYDIQSFIQNWDRGMSKQSELISDAMMAHKAMSDIGIDVDSLAEGFEKVTARHRQALDVIEFIASFDAMGPAHEDFAKARKAAQAFIAPVKKRIAEMEKENENPPPAGLNSHPTVAPQIIPLPSPDASADAQEGEPRS